MSYFVSGSFEAARFAVCTPHLAPSVDHNLSGYTVITKYLPLFLRSSGTGVRVTLRGPIGVGHTVTLSNVTISLAANASTSDLYDSVAAPTAVTFRSLASVSLARHGFALSDEIAFTIDRTRAILLAYNVPSSGGGIVPFTTGLSQQLISTFRRAATAEAGTTNRTTGYSGSPGVSVFLHRLETFA